jgi:energy-coupling factor transporter ATP-binding protein EcfA2
MPSIESLALRHQTNPFATRHTRPGVLPPLDGWGSPRDIDAFVASVCHHGATAIVGPHGTGKSTLLAAVAASLSNEGRLAGVVRLRRRRESLWVILAVVRTLPGSTLCVDGWERMGWGIAWVVRRLAKFRGCGLVVTSHGATGMPAAVHTAGTLPLLAAIVGHLPTHRGLVNQADLAEAFALHRGNLRDSLNELYDRFEQRSRRS